MARLTRKATLETGKNRGIYRKGQKSTIQERFNRLAGPVEISYKETKSKRVSRIDYT